ncbi:MAG: prephenate dehydrogenase/arogenate dehydrogenase family protein [Deltaproteobacteria bacterium]|nr:prephenate dehydrogenase/arogenate dehydrogenase family protein [Deltaproteobacteria bacterium]
MAILEVGAVVGLGLIGGSFAQACQGRGLFGALWGVDADPRVLDQALAARAIDRALPGLDGLRDARFVLIATPVGAIVPTVRALVPVLRAGTMLTDVGSVKAPVVRAVDALLPPHLSFVGGHPLAGGEQPGFAAASAGLFEGSRCILTPSASSDLQSVEAVRQIWEALGATVLPMAPEVHDRIVAATSHLPHLVAYALVAAVLAGGGPGAFMCSGGALRDLSRVAKSPPAMWRDIALLNRPRILTALDDFEAALQTIRAALEQGDAAGLHAHLERAWQALASLP